jgi:predicted nucleic acid-binding protein
VSRYLLDTNVVSELSRPRPSPKVVAFLRDTPLTSLFLSDLVVAEIRFGIESAPDPVLRQRYAAWLKDTIRPMFLGRVLAITEDVFLRWRLLLEAGRRKGYTFSEPDLIIAATAAHYGLTVVTRDIAPFEQVGVNVIDPWKARA